MSTDEPTWEGVRDELRAAGWRPMGDAYSRMQDRDRLVEVAARALYERDEQENRDQDRDADSPPWDDAVDFVRANYLTDAGPVVDALLAHIGAAGGEQCPASL